MKKGTLYGIGIGPGDPDLITLKAVKVIAACRHVFVPKSKEDSESLALNISRAHIHPNAQVHEILFPMTSDKEVLDKSWDDAAHSILRVLETGEDACFLTLGDAFLYSTYIYLLRRLRKLQPHVDVVTVPGVTAFSAAAAAAECPLGQGKESLIIVPTADDLEEMKRAVRSDGTVVLMKIGKRLERVLEVLDDENALHRSVFVSRVGLKGERVVNDLRSMRLEAPDRGYLSTMIVKSAKGEDA